jgi:transcription-repair coupling factor (superfamily II helicase)
MNVFKQTFSELSEYREIKKYLEAGLSPIMATGLSPIHKAQLILALESGKTSLIVTDDESTAKKLCDDINAMSGEHTAYMFPSREFITADTEGVSREYEHIRISALSAVMNGSCRIIASSVEALMQETIPAETLKNSTVTIEKGQTVDINELCVKLTEYGYAKSEKTEGASQFSVRGSIIDIYPVNEHKPVRIELWDDEIDTISYFDAETQRRDNEIASVMICPAKETLYNNCELADKLSEFERNIKDKAPKEFLKRLSDDIHKLKNGLELENADKYIRLIYSGNPSVADYIDGNIFICEYNSVAVRAEGISAQHHEDIQLMLEENIMINELFGYMYEAENLTGLCSEYPCIYLSHFAQGTESIRFAGTVHINAIQNETWGGEMRNLTEQLSDYCKNGYKTVLLAGSEKTIPIISQDLREKDIPCDIYGQVNERIAGRVLLMHGSLSAGYEYPEIKSALIAQNRSVNTMRKSKKHKKGEEIRSLADIAEGDLIVHSLHGIGRFIGIRKIELEGITKDYISIQYAGKDKLNIPVTQLDMISKYIGPRDDSSVKLNKLSSNDWQKTKNNVKKSVKDMAGELIELYAKREKAQGFKYAPDDDMQYEFEKRFPYTETDDQLNCIAEIKEDMERTRPMDRLLCGDVGFGKTEVAFRAMFKAVTNGKQCALLVPTTVLAWQHYQTASRRFEKFPVTIELLSRFRNQKQQAEILKKLKSGEIDIIIGTHRLVQKDVHFKDLGLAVIDEEQRFGVAHKEKFKQTFAGIDMLTLSATPIPRTLNMAMSGMRDMSVIEEPPQDRYPVQTYVTEHNTAVIVQAISKELKRGGQVYYIHNRIETIAECAGKLQQLMPYARIVYAHGQMSEETMSETWRKIVDGEADVLVCTTIIETGVDVPNVNTLIIENADCFGLSQLYQLRGRVGRSNRRAYAYFTFRRGKIISEVASKRLEAIKQFTQFGSGFRIAMRDLEIRGAGSILSAKQHGHMEAVGYDMYLKLLSEAIAEEKGEELPKKADDCVVDIQIDAYIPEKYIESPSQRIDMYRKIAMVSDENDKSDIIAELIDRYGEPPRAVTGLIDIAVLRNTASNLGITEVSQRNGSLLFYTANPSIECISALSGKYKGRVMFNNLAKSYISVKLARNEKPAVIINEVLSVMKQV